MSAASRRVLTLLKGQPPRDASATRPLPDYPSVLRAMDCYACGISDDERQCAGRIGPRRVSQDEIRASFRDGWQINSIEVATIETTMSPLGVPAWHATITRTAEESRRI